MPTGYSSLHRSRPILLTEIVEMGGAERSVLALARWLHEHHLPVHVVTYVDLPGLASFTSHPLEVVQLRPAMDPVHKVLALRQYLDARPSSAPKPLASGYQPALHATLAGAQGFHCLMHDTPSLFSDIHAQHSLKQRFGRYVSDQVVGYGLRSGGHTMVTSEFLQADCRRIFGIQAEIARMGGLAQNNPASLRPVTTTLHMLSVSRLEANKRIDWILRALAALEARTPRLSAAVDWQLDIAGRGSHMASLSQLAQELGIGSRVHLHGFVSDAQLQQLYDATHLFLMPAVQGYGIPAVESLGRGIPVLLHRESGVSDILLDTPWATVLEGGQTSMLPALERAINTVRSGTHLLSKPPALPTEDNWAERVANLCRWTGTA